MKTLGCNHQSPGEKPGDFICAAGLYGGKPRLADCGFCIAKGKNVRGIGDVVERLAKPIAKALNLPCLDKTTGNLRPESGCAKRRDRMNKALPFKHDNDTPDPAASSIPEEVPRTDGTQGVGSP